MKSISDTRRCVEIFLKWQRTRRFHEKSWSSSEIRRISYGSVGGRGSVTLQQASAQIAILNESIYDLNLHQLPSLPRLQHEFSLQKSHICIPFKQHQKELHFPASVQLNAPPPPPPPPPTPSTPQTDPKS